MKIVHLGRRATVSTPTGGAGIAFRRILEAQRSVGIDFRVVVKSHAEEPESIAPHYSLYYKFIDFVAKVLFRLFGCDLISSGLIRTGLIKEVMKLNPDIVHIHWIQNITVGIRELTRIKCPIVWTLHDLWPMLGTESSPTSDWYKEGAPSKGILNKIAWKVKRRVISELKDQICVVGSSRWVCEAARASVVFRGCRVEQIPLPISDEFYAKAWDVMCRSRIPNKRFVILFGASGSYKNPIKGFDRLQEAMSKLPNEVKRRCEIHIFGCDAASFICEGVSYHFRGRHSPEHMPHIYRQCDLLAFPSRQETWGQVKVEALVCGVPVVAFNESACGEGIVHGESGWIAKPGDIQSYADGLLYYYKIWERTGTTLFSKNYSEYTSDCVGKQWRNLYKTLCEK